MGLCLAHILEEHGVPWFLLEERNEPDVHSRAIGVAPPSQAILQRIGVLPQIEQSGVLIHRAYIHGTRGRGIPLDFDQLPDERRHIISIPQVQTEAILRRSLEAEAQERMWYGTRARTVRADGRGVIVEAERAGETLHFAGEYLCGCDGIQSTVRGSLIGLDRDYRYPECFAMGDFEDHSKMGDEAHLFFTKHGSVEAFPLPGGIRRWIVQTERFYAEPSAGTLVALVQERCGYTLHERHCSWRSAFRIRRSFASAMAVPPVFLAGDAAHTVPPIGGQGMNLGIADAEHLGDLLSHAYRSGGLSPAWVAGYRRRRFHAATYAGLLSLAGMRVGTVRGVAAPLRDGVLRALLGTTLSHRFMREFAMLKAPYTRSPWAGELTRLTEPDNREQPPE